MGLHVGSQDEIVPGVRAVDLRAALRRMRWGQVDDGFFEHWLKLRPGTVARTVRDLADRKFIQSGGKSGWWFIGPQGRKLANSRFGPRLKRDKADALLLDVIRRAQLINTINPQAVRVTGLWVFGSYLSRKPELGDLDIAFNFRMTKDDDELWEWAEDMAMLWTISRRCFYLGQVSVGCHISAGLRDGSPYIMPQATGELPKWWRRAKKQKIFPVGK